MTKCRPEDCGLKNIRLNSDLLPIYSDPNNQFGIFSFSVCACGVCVFVCVSDREREGVSKRDVILEMYLFILGES